MSNSVTIRDVSRAAGVSISTVSFVVNGKADRYRIGQDTQDRVLAAVRQLGYQSTPIVNSGASQPVLAVSRDPGKPVDKICLVLSSASSPDSFSMILGLEPVLAAAGYQLVVSVIPIDPAAARERVIQLLKSGTTGMVCCPTVYSTVSAVVAKACLELGRTGCPVIVLWQGAGKAMVATLQGVNTELEAPSVAKPAVNATPVVLPPTTPVSPAPRPVVPPPIINPVRPVVAPIAGVTVASPIIKQSPVLPVPVVIPAATPPIPELVVTPDPAPPPVIVQAPEPVLEPVPVVEPEPDI
ncbi:MAG: LacI family DNA-binding transcriptional regulator, partial [bacterium]